MNKTKRSRKKSVRNDKLYDGWSLIHVVTGIALGWLVNPYAALLMLVLWEPLEILVISPIMLRRGSLFGYESFRNSLSDIFFDMVGIYLGWVILTDIIAPPIHLF